MRKNVSGVLRREFRRPRAQRGAVLYIALIMLILLALLGVIGMQVSGMQERMAYNYRTLNLAFQRAEASARSAECFVESTVNRTATTCPTVAIQPICDDGFDASTWAQARAAVQPTADALNVRAIGKCISGNSSLAMGGAEEEDPNPVFQVTAFANDGTPANGASAAVDTIFRP